MNLRLEAILFALGKRTTVTELALLLKQPEKQVETDLLALQKHYESQETSLNLQFEGGSWKFTVKDEYLELVKGLVSKTELDRPTMETLAVIAFKYPVLQSDIIDVRGGGAYDHIKQLSELGYVVKEKYARSFKLKLTPKFFEYFDLPQNKLKDAFADIAEMAAKIEEQSLEAQQKREEAEREEKKQHKLIEVKKENTSLDQYNA